MNVQRAWQKIPAPLWQVKQLQSPLGSFLALFLSWCCLQLYFLWCKSKLIKCAPLPYHAADVRAESVSLCRMTSTWSRSKGSQRVVFSSSGSPAGEASISGIWSLISPSCLKFLIEYLQYQALYGWIHAAVLWLSLLTLTTCLMSAESVTHTHVLSQIY